MTTDTIIAFFAEKGHVITDLDQDLFKGGYINSLFALEMVLYLEKSFKIRIKEKDISEDNFRSINKIAALVEKNLKG